MHKELADLERQERDGIAPGDPAVVPAVTTLAPKSKEPPELQKIFDDAIRSISIIAYDERVSDIERLDYQEKLSHLLRNYNFKRINSELRPTYEVYETVKQLYYALLSKENKQDEIKSQRELDTERSVKVFEASNDLKGYAVEVYDTLNFAARIQFVKAYSYIKNIGVAKLLFGRVLNKIMNYFGALKRKASRTAAKNAPMEVKDRKEDIRKKDCFQDLLLLNPGDYTPLLVALPDGDFKQLKTKLPPNTLVLYFDTAYNVTNHVRETRESHCSNDDPRSRSNQIFRQFAIGSNILLDDRTLFSIPIPLVPLDHEEDDDDKIENLIAGQIHEIQLFIDRMKPSLILWPGSLDFTFPVHGVCGQKVSDEIKTHVTSEMRQLIDEKKLVSFPGWDISFPEIEKIQLTVSGDRSGPDYVSLDTVVRKIARVRQEYESPQQMLNTLKDVYEKCRNKLPYSKVEALTKVFNEKNKVLQKVLLKRSQFINQFNNNERIRERILENEAAAKQQKQESRKRKERERKLPDYLEESPEPAAESELLEGSPYRAHDPRFERGNKRQFLKWIAPPEVKTAVAEISKYIIQVEAARRTTDGTTIRAVTDTVAPLSWFESHEPDEIIKNEENALKTRFSKFLYPARDHIVSIKQFRHELFQLAERLDDLNGAYENAMNEFNRQREESIPYERDDFWDFFSIIFLETFRAQLNETPVMSRKLNNPINLLARVKKALFQHEYTDVAHCEGTRKNTQETNAKTDRNITYRMYDGRFPKGGKINILLGRFSKKFKYAARRVVPDEDKERFYDDPNEYDRSRLRYGFCDTPIFDKMLEVIRSFLAESDGHFHAGDGSMKDEVRSLETAIQGLQRQFHDDAQYKSGELIPLSMRTRIEQKQARKRGTYRGRWIKDANGNIRQKRVSKFFTKYQVKWHPSNDDFIDLFSVAYAHQQRKRNPELNPSQSFYKLKQAIFGKKYEDSTKLNSLPTVSRVGNESCKRVGKNGERHRRARPDEKQYFYTPGSYTRKNCDSDKLNKFPAVRKYMYCHLNRKTRERFFKKWSNIFKAQRNTACETHAEKEMARLESYQKSCPVDGSASDETDKSDKPFNLREERRARKHEKALPKTLGPPPDASLLFPEGPEPMKDPKTCRASEIRLPTAAGFDNDYPLRKDKQQHYKKTMRKIHPDKNLGCPEMAERKSKYMNQLKAHYLI